MSLYNHVASKDDLLDGMLDLVLAECEQPAPDGDWREAVRRSAISVHEALGRHPWAAHLLRSMDALLGRLRVAGFSADATYHADHVIDAHMIGFSLWLATHSVGPEDSGEHLHEHALQHLSDGPHRAASAFEFGLELLLESLERLRKAGLRSRSAGSATRR